MPRKQRTYFMETRKLGSDQKKPLHSEVLEGLFGCVELLALLPDMGQCFGSVSSLFFFLSFSESQHPSNSMHRTHMLSNGSFPLVMCSKDDLLVNLPVSRISGSFYVNNWKLW